MDTASLAFLRAFSRLQQIGQAVEAQRPSDAAMATETPKENYSSIAGFNHLMPEHGTPAVVACAELVSKLVIRVHFIFHLRELVLELVSP